MTNDTVSVLVVDDDEDIRLQCRMVLEAQGTTIDTAEDGAEALEMVQRNCYDLVLTDLRMPEVGGMELLARLQHTCPEIGIVVMTAYPASETAVESIRCGALDYIKKPIEAQDLVTTIRRALEARERIKQERKVPTTHEPESDMAPGAVASAVAGRVSIAKATLPWINLGILGLLAGAYIGFGAALATLVSSDAGQYIGFGMAKLMGGLAFCVGLILVVVAGAELFTGNNLMVTGALGRNVTFGQMVLRWLAVYGTNLVGSVMLAGIVFGSGIWHANGDLVGITALKIANAKVNLGFLEAFYRGIGCNWLVCLAVWMSIGARRISGKILAIVFPITAFVALGFEHCVANMYFIPMGIFLGGTDMAAVAGLDLSNLGWFGFFVTNLVPVTVGNIVGGGIFVGVLYWAAYLPRAMRPQE